MFRNFFQIILALFFYALFTLAVFWDPIVNKFGSIQWDAISVHFFNLLFSSETWHGGILPLWTPYIFNGFPQIADLQVAVFYPINSVIGLFSVFSADLMLYQAIFHYFLAGFFAFLLFRYLSGNFLMGLGAGAAYAFGGFMAGHSSHIGMQNTAAWLPLIFLFLLLALNKHKITYAVFCGFFLGVAILAGHFQTALYISFAIGLYFAFDFLYTAFCHSRFLFCHPPGRTVRTGSRENGNLDPHYFNLDPRLRGDDKDDGGNDEDNSKHTKQIIVKKTLIIILIFTVAFLISAVQLLPTYELTKQSQRAQISPEMSQTESLDPQSLWALVYPNYNNVSHNGAYQGPWDRTQNYLYLSITILILAIIGMIAGISNKGTRRMTIFFILLAGVSALYSFGQYGFLQKYFYQFIPFFDKIRAPSNMMLLFNLAIIGLAAMAGMSLRGTKPARTTIQSGRQSIFRFSEIAALHSPPAGGLAMTKQGFTIKDMIVFLIISLEIFIAASQNELLYAGKNSSDILREPWIAQNILSEYGALDEIDKFKVFKIPEFADNQTQMRQIYAFDGYNPLALARYGNFVDAMVKNANLVDLAGIKYLPCQYIPERAEKSEKVGNLCINKNYHPRAFFVDHFIAVENEQDALLKLSSAEVRPRQIVILEENPYITIKSAEVEPRQIPRQIEIVEIIDAKPGFWKLNVKNDNDSFLFFGQTDYPGWTAKIDDRETKIYKADYLFQAVFTPAGQHEIIFEFRSKQLKMGAILTIIGLIIVILSGLAELTTRRFEFKK